MDIIVICSINFYEKHFLIFFDLFLVLLHLWEAGGQLIDINVHWQIQFTFYFLWGFISLLFTWAFNLSISVFLFSYPSLHLCNIYNYKKTIIFNKVKAKSSFLIISVLVKENTAHHFINVAVCIFFTILHIRHLYIYKFPYL